MRARAARIVRVHKNEKTIGKIHKLFRIISANYHI